MKKAFSITVDEDLYKYVQDQAEADSRTISSYIEKLIRDDKKSKEE